MLMERNGTWLCPTERDRERLVDMSARVKKARTISAGALRHGPARLDPVGRLGAARSCWSLVGVNLAIIEGRLAARSSGPSTSPPASMFFLQCVIGGGRSRLTGGPHSPMIAWIVVPTAVVAARFRRQVVFAFAASRGRRPSALA